VFTISMIFPIFHSDRPDRTASGVTFFIALLIVLRDLCNASAAPEIEKRFSSLPRLEFVI
jgi:hypothetical protein